MRRAVAIGLVLCAGLPACVFAQGPFTQSQAIDPGLIALPGAARIDIPTFVTDAGDVFGFSETLVNIDQNDLTARAIWRANAAGADLITLSGTQFVEPTTGAVLSSLTRVNARGQAAGVQFFGQVETTGYFTRSQAWFFDGVRTRAVGLQGDALGLTPFTEENDIAALSDDGITIGRYTATVSVPSDQLPTGAIVNIAWASRDGANRPLGFNTGVFVRPFVGQRSSGASAVNNRGQIAGHSDRFNANAEIDGRVAWRYDLNRDEYVTMGLTGPSYADPSQGLFGSSFATMIADDGTVAGISELLQQTAGTGVWVFRNGVTTEVGLRGPLYDIESGFPSSELRMLTNTGIAAGVTTLADLAFGQSVWVAIDGVTTRVGPASSDFIGPVGDEISVFADINDNGLVGGSTQTFNAAAGTFGLSRLAWVQNARNTTVPPRVLALTDPLHGTSQFASEILDINNQGFVVGQSFQFGSPRLPNGGIPGSSFTPWLFDSNTGDFTAVPLPPTTSGRSSGFVLHLTPRGGVVGLFLVGVGADTTEFYRPFYWSRNAGFVDLAPTGPLYTSPWDTKFPLAVSPDGTRVVIGATLLTGDINLLRITTSDFAGCDSIDFNNNTVFPEDQDVIDFFTVLAGGECLTCNDIDFNNNTVFPEDQDVIDFFTVLAGGACS